MHDLIQAVQSSKKRLMSKIAHTVPVGVELLCGIALPMETKAQRTKPECTRAKPSRPKLEKMAYAKNCTYRHIPCTAGLEILFGIAVSIRKSSADLETPKTRMHDS